MAITVEKFLEMANCYNQITMLMSAICVQKGGIAMEHYVGRFFAADALEFIAEYGRRVIDGTNDNVPADIRELVHRFEVQAKQTHDLTTPSQRPIYEMSLEEFEKLMNI